jgi:hypothetical protein
MWRTGKQVPINVYDGDRPVCQCHSEQDAKRIVVAVNLADDLASLPLSGGEIAQALRQGIERSGK